MALDFSDDQAAKLLDTLGLPENTTDIDIVIATGEDLAAKAAGVAPIPDKPSDLAEAAHRAGLVVLDQDSVDTLRAEAESGRRLAAAANASRIAAMVEDAVKRGKIAPARRNHWQNLIAKDPAMADYLNGLPDNMLPVAEVGHGNNPDPAFDLLGEPEWYR
jgi:hypothetical protein